MVRKHQHGFGKPEPMHRCTASANCSHREGFRAWNVLSRAADNDARRHLLCSIYNGARGRRDAGPGFDQRLSDFARRK